MAATTKKSPSAILPLMSEPNGNMNKTESAENAQAKSLAESLEAALEKIRVTLESSKARQTTPPPLNEKQKEEAKRQWLDRWLKLSAHHPQLKALEDAVYDFTGGYGKDPSRGKRLILYGENGAGKSHTAKAVSRWAKRCAILMPQVVPTNSGDLEPRGPVCEFWNWAHLLSTLKSGEWHLIEELCHVELLIIDDLGADHDPSKFGAEKLYLLLEGREHRWTVITTNVRLEAWEEKFERRIASRFLRNSVLVPLTEVPDYNSLT